ncbi:MAG: 2-hydroxychromene-2-carboxylate isomerase [Pseudomonadota bacterium]
MAQLEFFFDCSSPWTYLAFSRVEDICREYKTALIWKPFLVGGVFNTVNQSVYEQRANPVPIKQRYYQKDLRDWADFQGVSIGSPPVFPVNSVKAMRGAFVALEAGRLSAYAKTVFETYWGDLLDISQEEILRDIVVNVGLNPDEFFSKIAEQDYKDRLRANTDELIERGGFGSPTIFINQDDMYFGNDRMELVRNRLRSLQGAG